MSEHRKVECPNINTWRGAFNKLYNEADPNNLNPELIIPASQLPNPEDAEIEFEESLLSLSNGAEEVYRDNRVNPTLQVRIYRDRNPSSNQTNEVYHIQLDQYNPSKGFDKALKHLIVDIIGVPL